MFLAILLVLLSSGYISSPLAYDTFPYRCFTFFVIPSFSIYYLRSSFPFILFSFLIFIYLFASHRSFQSSYSPSYWIRFTCFISHISHASYSKFNCSLRKMKWPLIRSIFKILRRHFVSFNKKENKWNKK